MELLILLKNWKLITIGLLALALVGITAAYVSRGNQIDTIIANYELAATRAELEYNKHARSIELQGQTNVINAINEAKAREQVIIADANSARDAVNSLSNTLSEVSTAAKLNAEIGDRYIDTSRRIITECSSEYQKMGEIASRLDNDLRLSQQAGRR